MYEKLIITGGITLIILVLPLVSIALDFWSGTRKAKQRREPITSEGWKRTVAKINKYYNFILAMLVIDALQVLFFWTLDVLYDYSIPLVPVFTTLSVLVVCSIEVKSIFEKADAKDRKDISDIASLAHAVGQNKESVAEMVAIVLKNMAEQKEKTDDHENTDNHSWQ